MSSPYYIPSNPIPYRILCHLSFSTVAKFHMGLNFLEIPSNDENPTKSPLLRLLIYQNPDKTFVICRNSCRHAGGNFVHDIEDLPEIVRCTYHGWKLNVQTLEYMKPVDCLKQKQLTIDRQENGDLLILEPLLYEPWTIDSKEKQDLQDNELTIGYINHACVEIQAGEKRLIVEPWLIDSCYDRSWWLFHEIDDQCWNRITNADGIFISKSSPDHLNLPTLERIAQINPNIQIYLPEIMLNSFKYSIKQLGFIHIHELSFGLWQKLDNSQARLMILPDHQHPHLDSVLLFEYKGHQIVNLVDCLSPNGEYLPYSIDVLLTNFTSNKTAYPSCFVDQFGEEQIYQIAKTKDEIFIKKIMKFIQLTYPSLWIPIGGYFIEAGPDDEQIRRLNWKNNPSDVSDRLKARFPFLKTWCPFPGGRYDLGTKIADQPSKLLDEYLKTSWNFQSSIDQSMHFKPLQTMEGIKQYFQWTLFHHYDLVLHMIEVTNNFAEIIREYYVDFLPSNPIVLDCMPEDRPYLRIRIRASVVRDVFMRGYSWNYLFNGFSARYFAQPNIYHRKFWNYFKYNLPYQPPQWNQSQQPMSSDLLQSLEQWNINTKKTD